MLGWFLQVLLKRQEVSNKLHEWTSFSDKCKDMADNLEDMEKKIMSNSDYDIEDLLDKLQGVGTRYRRILQKSNKGIGELLKHKCRKRFA